MFLWQQAISYRRYLDRLKRQPFTVASVITSFICIARCRDCIKLILVESRKQEYRMVGIAKQMQYLAGPAQIQILYQVQTTYELEPALIAY